MDVNALRIELHHVLIVPDGTRRVPSFFVVQAGAEISRGPLRRVLHRRGKKILRIALARRSQIFAVSRGGVIPNVAGPDLPAFPGFGRPSPYPQTPPRPSK